MVSVKVRNNSIEMNGHAGCSVNGQDIVCASVSVLTCNLINGINLLTDDQIQYETGPGKTVIRWQKISDKAKLLVDSWFLGITAIGEKYNCINFV